MPPIKTALVVAHPGHELRLATWVASARPVVSIIAKGSRSGQSEARIQASRALVTELGAKPAEPFGIAFDADIYRSIMASDIAAFSRIADDLRAVFLREGVTTVVADSWQNYNPVHDLTHALARVAAAEAAVVTGRAIEVFDYPVVMGRLAHAEAGPEHLRLELSPAQIEAKMALADQYPEIVDDVRSLSQAVGEQAFALESLHRPAPLRSLMCTPDALPWYELYGEERVKAGVYSEVLRWSHIEPIVAMLADRLDAAQAEDARPAIGVQAE